jgi:hypothetical protein
VDARGGNRTTGLKAGGWCLGCYSLGWGNSLTDASLHPTGLLVGYVLG